MVPPRLKGTEKYSLVCVQGERQGVNISYICYICHVCHLLSSIPQAAKEPGA